MVYQAANLKRFSDPLNPRFEGGIPDFMDGIPGFMEKFKTFYCGICRNLRLKSLNSMTVYHGRL